MSRHRRQHRGASQYGRATPRGTRPNGSPPRPVSLCIICDDVLFPDEPTGTVSFDDVPGCFLAHETCVAFELEHQAHDAQA